ncbi:MAG: hypothetical protein FD134_103 [Gallionellaceae bacterium]|nr:MAG: hypothetical protein FD134_103 [Gallionellaceae bacterium]
MFGTKFMTNTLLVLTAAIGSTNVQAADADANLRAELDRVAQRRIYFGHQSVGSNLLDGVKQLAEKAGVSIRVTEAPTAGEVPPATFGHTAVAKNGDPLLKLQSFEQAMGQQPAGLDIALVKFCYVDISADTDAKALFARYRATMDALHAKHPGTTLMHVTAPLTIAQGGLKAGLKKLLGRVPYGVAENRRREEFNALMRQAYQGKEPIFDLARIESTAPDGTTVTVDWEGTASPAMAAAYTDDGGHLNTAGKLRAARELVSALAAIPARPAPEPAR